MSIEDVNYMKENSIKQAYTFIVDSAERERDLYPNPNNYVVNFSTPYKNIIGMEIIDASIPRAMYTIDVDNNELYYYVGAETGDNLIEDGMQIYNTANLMLQNWNYTSNISSISSNISSSSNIISGYLASNITNDIKIINDISGITYETTVITTNSNITDIYKILTSSNVITSSNIINNSNIFYTSNLYNTVNIYNTSNISKSSNISLTSRLLTASNILTTSNIFNFTNITNISRSSNISNLDLSGDRYAILNNSINLYNIYNNENNIGGYTEGITFNMCVLPIISSGSGGSASYNIMNFGYSHTYSLEADGDIIYRNVRVDVAKATNSSYTFSFTIGERTESVFNIIGSASGGEINIYWSILKTTWYIGIFDIDKTQLAYKEFYNCDQMYNVFYTKKYLGLGSSGSSGSGWGNNLLLFKDFKIYNVPMSYSMMAATAATTTSPIIWYKMDEVVNNEIINKGTSPIIEYKDIFKRLVIKGGDYTFKTFISKYDELRKNNDMELLFKETTAPPELSNLIDIYSKAPIIVDMKRSTLAENIGFDLYPTANNEDKYISKPYTTTESVLAKMFYSRSNATYDIDVSSENKYIITSPGIVYFIGNKYIIMRCPEIEEHLYRSLSYSKNTLGLAKFRVDSIGINSEKLTITKIPVREFHPIGKLSRMTLRFETNKGRLYDFKGLNHNIIFAIFYYEPVQKNIPKNSILNPEYKMNYLDYLYKQEEIEGDSDDDEGGDEDFSRDNIDDYKIKENLYSKRGVELQQSNNYYQNNKMTNVIMENEDANASEAEDAEADEGTDDNASEDANEANDADEYN
jgi:hypothetical protein